MSFTFEPEQCRLVFAHDYLTAFRQRGKALSLKHLGLTFYGLTDCLHLGQDCQSILPVRPDGGLPFIFKESCPYLANEPHLAPIAAACLEAAPDILEVDEAAPLYGPSSENLWHWTTEHLPKLLALESIGYTGRYIVPFASAVAMQSMEMFGIPQERLLQGDACYRVKRLMLPQRLSGFTLVENMPLAEFTRGRLLEAVGRLDGGKRCYVRRVGRRKPINEADVLAVLNDFGFEVMVPEELSLPEQWRYMTNVDCSVMAHGANSTLSWLQKPGSGFVELFSNRYVSYNNLHAVRLLRLKYHSIVQDLDVSSAPTDGMTLSEFLWGGYQADMEVDTTHLRVILESLLG